MELYYSISVIIVIATVFSYLNIRFLKLPSTIGIMVIAIIVSLGLVLIGNTISSEPLQDLSFILREMDFPDLLMGVMLNFLLFAGAIHVNISDLKKQKTTIIIFSTISVIISAFVIGFALYYILNFVLPHLNLHLEIPLVYCLLFVALISPTDPIAVMSILKNSNVPKSIETKVSGESLFNDGISVVIFSVLLRAAEGETADLSFGNISWLLVKEVLGGIIIGLLLGFIAAKAAKRAADYKFSVLMTLSVVMGGSMLAHFMDISGPLTMVVSGLLIGESRRRRQNPSENSVDNFWELIDEIMNAVLFVLIGFELLLIPHLERYWLIGLICIIVVLLARYISIRIPTFIMPQSEKFSRKTLKILVWGGLRGGVSIALALSLSPSPYKQVLIAATYFVVLFSIIVQGLTIGRLVNRMHFSSTDK